MASNNQPPNPQSESENNNIDNTVPTQLESDNNDNAEINPSSPEIAAPEPAQATTKFNLKFADQRRTELYFRLSLTTAMGVAMETFAKHIQMRVDELRFMIDSERINKDSTAEKMDLEDGDQIDVFYHSTGGGEDGWFVGRRT